MTQRKRRKGPGIIWTYPPPKPLSPAQIQRASEFTLIYELADWIADSFRDWAKQEGDRRDRPITMLLAATRWFCLLGLPTDWLDLFRGPPMLSRVPGQSCS